MKRMRLMVFTALIPVLAAAAGTTALYAHTGWVVGADLQPFKMTIEEVDRLDRSSVVEVSGAGSGSSATSGFILGGMCELAKMRRQRFFQARQVLKDPLTFEVTFFTTGPNSAMVPADAMAPNVFSVAFCPVPGT